MGTMKVFFWLPALLCVVSTARSEVEVIAGVRHRSRQRTFSVDFDSRGILYGVEFTKANRIFRVVDGKVEFVAGIQHNVETNKPPTGLR